jgi:hypothetical protein
MKPRHLNAQEWDEVRLEYETSRERPTLRQLADKHGVSRSRIFKRAAREKWTQNAKVVEAARKQIVKKMEAATSEAAQLVAKEIVEDLRPWIQRQKAEHIKRAVAMGKRGFERIERLWDEKEPVDPKQESFAAATLNRHDDIVRRNLGMNDEERPMSSLNLNVLCGGRAIVQIAPALPEQAPTLPVGESISPERRAME